MVYIASTLIRKAFENKAKLQSAKKLDDVWKTLMLEPKDYAY